MNLLYGSLPQKFVLANQNKNTLTKLYKPRFNMFNCYFAASAEANNFV